MEGSNGRTSSKLKESPSDAPCPQCLQWQTYADALKENVQKVMLDLRQQHTNVIDRVSSSVLKRVQSFSVPDFALQKPSLPTLNDEGDVEANEKDEQETQWTEMVIDTARRELHAALKDIQAQHAAVIRKLDEHSQQLFGEALSDEGIRSNSTPRGPEDPDIENFFSTKRTYSKASPSPPAPIQKKVPFALASRVQEGIYELRKQIVSIRHAAFSQTVFVAEDFSSAISLLKRAQRDPTVMERKLIQELHAALSHLVGSVDATSALSHEIAERTNDGGGELDAANGGPPVRSSRENLLENMFGPQNWKLHSDSLAEAVPFAIQVIKALQSTFHRLKKTHELFLHKMMRQAKEEDVLEEALRIASQAVDQHISTIAQGLGQGSNGLVMLSSSLEIKNEAQHDSTKEAVVVWVESRKHLQLDKRLNALTQMVSKVLKHNADLLDQSRAQIRQLQEQQRQFMRTTTSLERKKAKSSENSPSSEARLAILRHKYCACRLQKAAQLIKFRYCVKKILQRCGLPETLERLSTHESEEKLLTENVDQASSKKWVGLVDLLQRTNLAPFSASDADDSKWKNDEAGLMSFLQHRHQPPSPRQPSPVKKPSSLLVSLDGGYESMNGKGPALPTHPTNPRFIQSTKGSFNRQRLRAIHPLDLETHNPQPGGPLTATRLRGEFPIVAPRAPGTASSSRIRVFGGAPPGQLNPNLVRVSTAPLGAPRPIPAAPRGKLKDIPVQDVLGVVCGTVGE